MMSVLNHPFYPESVHPFTPQARLAELAAAYPELHPAIASNPACYPGLLDWMRVYGTLAPVAESAAESAAEPVAETAAETAGPLGRQHLLGQPDPANPFSSMTATPSAAGRKKPFIIGGSIALVVLLTGGGVWASTAIASKLSGASTPQAAVEKLLNGVADLDPLRVYGALSPAEVESFQAASETLGELSTGAIDGTEVTYQKQFDEMMALTEVTLSDLQFQVDEIDDGIATVAVIGGELRVDVDPTKLVDVYFELLRPQQIAQYTDEGYDSAEIDDLIDDERNAAVDGLADTFPYSVSAGEIGDELGHNATIVAVEEGGSWYVSPLLTIGEQLYQSRDTDKPRGALVAAAESFPTPEDALEGFARGAGASLKTGSPAALAAALPLAERRFLSLYGDFLSHPTAVSLDITDISASSVIDGDTARIELDNLHLAAGHDGDNAWSADVSGVCAKLEGSQNLCLDDVPMLNKLGAGDLQLIAVKQGAGWFISPLRTASDAVAIALTNVVALNRAGELEDLLTSE